MRKELTDFIEEKIVTIDRDMSPGKHYYHWIRFHGDKGVMFMVRAEDIYDADGNHIRDDLE